MAMVMTTSSGDLWNSAPRAEVELPVNCPASCLRRSMFTGGFRERGRRQVEMVEVEIKTQDRQGWHATTQPRLWVIGIEWCVMKSENRVVTATGGFK
jgi:hypothetical protein